MAITCDVCDGELMIGAGGKTAKCTVCGISYSIERIREKINNVQTSGSEEKYMIFRAINMNWGQSSWMEGTWKRTEYKVYSDGTIWSKADFCYENPESFWGKLSQPVEELMKPEDFRELKQILNRDFEQAKTVDGCDGEGWEMTCYEKDGSEWHTLSGYIYGVDVLERIKKILEKSEQSSQKQVTEKNAKKEPVHKKEQLQQKMKDVSSPVEYVDYEIVDFEIVNEVDEAEEPERKKDWETVSKDEISREEDFIFITEFNEEIQENEEMLLEYIGKASTIVIPEKADILGKYEGKKTIFRYPERVKKIVLNKYVHTIGDYAFAGCSNLEEIHIPENVDYMWYSCNTQENPMAESDLPESSHIFEGCRRLKKVTFDENAWKGEDICASLFKGCSSLKEVILPKTVQWLGRSMFEDCVELEEIELPDSVAVIGQNAFKGCKKLKKVVLPRHPLAIHPTAFLGTKYTPPVQYTTGFQVNRCSVCGGKLNWGSTCKKCGRQIIYCGDKKDWK